jgi:hypothetical protein
LWLRQSKEHALTGSSCDVAQNVTKPWDSYFSISLLLPLCHAHLEAFVEKALQDKAAKGTGKESR